MNDIVKQTYRHTFKNGQVCTVIFELGSDFANIAVDPPSLPSECDEEFAIWIDQIVADDLLDRMSPEQMAFFVQAGIKFLNETIEKNRRGDEEND